MLAIASTGGQSVTFVAIKVDVGLTAPTDPAAASRPLPLRRASHLVGQRAVGECLGEVDAAHRLFAVKIGERARDPQHPVVAARGKAHGLGGFAQQREAAAIVSSTGPAACALVRTASPSAV